MKPIIECFEIGMNEKMLDLLLHCGVQEHAMAELKEVYAEVIRCSAYKGTGPGISGSC